MYRVFLYQQLTEARYENLSNIFNTAFKLGLNYNLCIDIFHIDVDAFNIEYWDNFTQTRFYDRIVVNGSPDLMIPSKPKKLPHGLYEFDSNKKTPKSLKKHITRVQSGQYLNLRFDLKTMKLISFN